jgi:hypothetical protein
MYYRATEQGFEYAAANPEESADILFDLSNHSSLNDLGRDFVRRSQAIVSANLYLDNEYKWGRMDYARWHNFISWLFANNCLTDREGNIIKR